MTQTTVLVVDDSPTMRGMIRNALGKGGYRVVEARHGLEALAWLEREAADLILTDINMPCMDGLTFIRQVRQRQACGRLPILALTTEGDAEMKAAGKAAGATGWIVKPFDPDQLCDVIGMVMRRMAGQSPPSSAGSEAT
jgi:two-component system chemotaxis response regulator CheY